MSKLITSMLLALLLRAEALSGEIYQNHSCPKQALFLIHKGQIGPALELYDGYYSCHGIHDTEFLQQLAISMLEQGARHSDPEVQAMALFGAGIAMNESALPILARAVSSPNPSMQLIALNFLGRYHDDEADRYALRALQSNYLPVRLEALYQMALKKLPKTANQIESLMGKVDPMILPIFPQLLGLLDDSDSQKIVKKLLSHSNEDVRIEAIACCASGGKDDLLPKIRSLATQPSAAQQEATAYAFGELNDEFSAPRLELFSNAPSSPLHVRLAALKSLYSMGRIKALDTITSYAKSGDLFAITLLGDIPGTEEILIPLMRAADFNIRLNATIALLKLQKEQCLPLLAEILIKDSRDLIFTRIASRGKTLSCWKAAASARQQFSDAPMELELSLHFREAWLAATIDLPEAPTLELITLILQKQQNDLVPAAIELLEKLQTPDAIALLKRYQQQPGAPLVRNFCNLALYRLGEEGPYGNNLALWIDQQACENLIQLRPYVPWELDDEHAFYKITPHETSRLLVEAFEALTRKQDNNGINTLLKAIKNGNQKNKYALAGLLIRAAL